MFIHRYPCRLPRVAGKPLSASAAFVTKTFVTPMPMPFLKRGVPDMQKIHQYLKGRGEQLDSEIAAATHTPLADVRLYLDELSKKGDVIACHTTRFIKGKKSEGMLYRMSGFIPAASPGRKPKANA
jgi:hypothetical protein